MRGWVTAVEGQAVSEAALVTVGLGVVREPARLEVTAAEVSVSTSEAAALDWVETEGTRQRQRAAGKEALVQEAAACCFLGPHEAGASVASPYDQAQGYVE